MFDYNRIPLLDCQIGPASIFENRTLGDLQKEKKKRCTAAYLFYFFLFVSKFTFSYINSTSSRTQDSVYALTKQV